MTEKERRQQRSAFLTEKNTKRDEAKSLLTNEEKERRKKRSSFLEVDKTVSPSPTSNHTPTPSRPVNMCEDEALRTLARQMQSAPDTLNSVNALGRVSSLSEYPSVYRETEVKKKLAAKEIAQSDLIDEYKRQQTGTQGAATALMHKENQQAAAFRNEAAEYFNSREPQSGSKSVTDKYKDKFYSMSDEERKLVAQINAFDEGYSKDGGARMNAAAELKNKYNYTNDDITAMVYFYNRYANKEKAKQEDIDARVAMDQHPFLESLASVPKGVAGGVMAAVGIADSALDNKGVKKIGIEDQGLDYNNEFSSLQRQAQSGRAEFTDTHDLMIGDYDVGDMLYNTALSGIESAAVAFVPGGAALFGVNAATAKANELSQRGLSTDKAIVGGIVSGVIEMLCESKSIENIKAFKQGGTKTIKDIALNVAKSLGVNFQEEATTEAANIIYDIIAHGDNSEFKTQMQSLMADGISEDEAFKKVLKATAFQVVEAGVSGAIMGAVFGAVGAGTSYIDNRANLANAGTIAKATEQTGAIIKEGQAAPEKSKAHKLAESMIKAQNKGKEISDYKLGLLEYENSRQGRVAEGTFAEIGNEADLEKAFDEKLLQLTAEKKKSDNKLHQLYNDIQHQKARDSLYEEYKAAKKQLEKSGGREGMQEAFEETLKEDVKRRAEAEKLRPEILTADGTQSKLDGSGIFKNAEGVNMVKTEDGKEIKVSELEFKDENTKKLYDATEGMTAEKANLFVSEYNGETVAEYGRAFDYYYRMGRTGMSVENIRKGDNIFSGVLSEEAQAKIATAGLKGREFQKGFTDLSAARKSERYKYESKVLQAVGEKRNLEIFVIDEDSDINGSYLAGTNRIVIRRNTEGGLLLRTAGHEAFHFIKNQVKNEAGKVEVEALEKFVLDALSKNGTDIEAEIKRLGELEDENTGETVYKTREDCIEEIVADSMFDVFTNEKFSEKLLNENRSLFGKIANKIKEILADIKSAIKMLGNSNAEIKALQDDVDSLEKINSMFDSLLEKAGESYKTENENGQKNNTAEAVKKSSKNNTVEKITRNMSDEERARILRNKKIKNIAFVRELSVRDSERFESVSSWGDIDKISGKEKRCIIQKIAKEFGVFKEYINDDVSLSFNFSNNNYRESFGKQKKNFQSFAKMFSVFEQVIESAVGVEVHNRNDEGYKFDPTLKNAYVLISAFGDGDSLVPVKLEVKEFRDKENTLYVAISLEKIKMTEVSKQGTTENGVAQNSRSVNVSISDLLLKINPKDVNFLKYIPDELLTDEQITFKNEEINREFKTDFRYSTKKTTPIQAHWAEAIRENHYFRNILTLLDEMQNSGGKIQLDGRSINKIAKDIIKTTSSRYDSSELADEITVLYDYMANSKNADTEEMFSAVLAIAEKVLEKSETKDTELYDQYKNVREYLRNQPIYITPAVKKEIESQFGDFKSFRKLLFGKAMHITTTDSSAMTLDEVWQELSELAPEYFPKEFNELDMPMQLTAFFEAVAPKVVNPYEHFQENIEDAAAELATEIFQKYYEVGRLQSPQEKYRNLVFENMQKLERNKRTMRQEFKNKVAENEQLNFENYRKRVTEYKQQREASDKRRKLKNEIDRNYNYLNRRLIRETDNDHIFEDLKPLVSAFRFIIPDSNSTFSKARFTEFENEYRKLEEKSSLFDADIAERISALCERLTPGIGAPKMRELDLFELEELRNISQHIKFIVQTENRLFSEANKGRVEDFAKAVIDELEGKKDSNVQNVPDFKYRGKWKDTAVNKLDALIKGFTKPEYLFGSLGSERIKQLYDELRKGENTEARIIFEAKEAETKIKSENHYDPRWETEMITLNMRGGELKITVEQAMALYATSKRHQGLEHMLGGGVVIYSSEKSKNAKGKDIERMKRSNRNFTEEDIALLQKSLTAQQKNYVNSMVEYITKDIGRKRNEIALKLNGIEKYKETYYFPVKVDRHFVDKSIGRQEVISTIKNQSSAKRTVEHAQNPIEITGFTETVNNHIYDSALYCAYVLPISDFKKVYNFRDKVSVGEGVESLIYRDVSVQDEIRRSNGINAIKQIEDFMVALDSGSRYENIIPTSAELMAKAKKVSVMANLSVVVQQPTAVFRAMLYINPKHFTTVANKNDIEEMKRWNGCALKKQIGYFDVNMGRTATDFMNEYSADKATRKEYSFGEKIRNGNIGLKIDQVAGWGAEKADEITWGAIWKACKKQTKAENTELSGEALNKAAAELFQTVISKTQVYDSVFTKPDYMRRKEGFAMMTTQFMSEPLTSLNMLAEAVVNAKKTKGTNQQKEARKFCGRAFACYVTSIVVNNALKGLIYAMRDDDEGNSFLEKYVANVIEGIATEPFGMIPYVKDIMSIVQGYDLERADVAVFTTFIDAFKTLLNSDKGAYEKISAVMKAAGQASGVPFYNVMRDTKAILGISNKISDGIKNGFEPTTGKGVFYQLKECFDIDFIPLIESSSNYEQLYDSIIGKDTRHYDKVYNNLIADGKEKSTIEGGIAKVLAEKNANLEAAYTLTSEGKLTDAANKINELKAAGFSDNVINKALNTFESNRVKELSEDERTEQAARARYNRNYDEYERIIKELVDEGNKESIVIKAIDNNKLELETKASDYTFDSEDTYDASYDLRNAIISNDDAATKRVYNRYVSEHGEEDAQSKMKTQIVKACKDKFISETRAESLLREYVYSDENDVFWEMEEIRTGGKYTKLKSAVDSGAVSRNVVEYYTDNGVEEGTVRQWLTNNYKSKLLSLPKGSAEYNELYDTLIDAYVASGMTEGKAKKKIREWYKE